MSSTFTKLLLAGCIENMDTRQFSVTTIILWNTQQITQTIIINMKLQNMNRLHKNIINQRLIMKKIAYFFIAAFFPFVVSAQENMFVVYSVKGTVSVVEIKVETKAKIGTIINNNSSIKIGAGSFATLLCNETKMFSL